MSERGGPTTQSGIYYQNSVAALYLGRLCDAAPRPDHERVTAVRAEAPAHVDDIVVTFADGHRAYVQAKETVRSGQEAWKGLWQHFGDQYHSASFERARDQLHFQVGEAHEEYEQLRQACERVDGSESHEEWWGRLTKHQQDLVDKIKQLLPPGLHTGNDLLAFFRHVRVEVWTPTHIERDLVPHWMPPSSVTPETLFRLLRDRVGGKARVRGSFAAESLSRSLEAENQVRLVAPPSLDELRAAVRGCGALLRQQKHTIGHTGRHVQRAVVDKIADWVLTAATDQKVAALLDQAGSGKTVVVRDVLHALEGRGVAVLAIKADLQLSGLSRHEDLPALLGLPETVERTMHRLAAAGPACVLIDQVDALSLSLAHDQAALNVVLDLVARLRDIPGVRLLLSCRAFDFHNDPRLSRTDVPTQFPLGELAAADVQAVLAEVGIPSDGLAPATRELLRIPLHLDLFVTAMAGQLAALQPPHALSSLQDLYGLLWRNVVLRPGVPPVAEREEVLQLLTEDMDRRQRTSAPRVLLTGITSSHLEAAARWLASAGILLATRNEWSFMHQTFFDYCYAKRFVEKEASLADAVLRGEQGLFARPQLLQVLTYLRGSDPKTCLGEFNALVAAPGLRFHLHDLLLRWFGSLPDPSQDESTLLRRLLGRPPLRPRLLRAIQGNAGWFDQLSGVAVRELLALDDRALDDEVIPYLTSMLEARQAAVVSLLRPYLGRGAAWDNRLRWVVRRVGRWHTAEAIALFEEVVRAAYTSDLQQFHELDDVAKADPPAGCRTLRLMFDRLFDAFLSGQTAEGGRHLRSLPHVLEDLNGSAAHNALQAVSEAEPGLFLEQMLPWLERALRSTEVPRPDALYFGADELAHGWHDRVYVVQHALVDALVSTLGALARRESAAFRAAAARLAGLPYQTPQQLLARAYAETADTHAADGLAFLLGDRRRLNLGDHEQYESRRLIAALCPRLSDPQCAELEAAILAYAPVHPYGKTLGLRWRGLEQFYLLQEIPPSRLTERGARRLRELRDKFPEPEAQASRTPVGMRGGVVGPPISRDAVAKMSDDAWLGAMRKYHGEVEHKDFLRGGARQLGRVLTERVREDPARFHRLLRRTPEDLDDNYAQALLNGLAEADAPAEWLFGAVRRFAPRPGRDLRRTVAWALEKRAAEGLPDDLMAMLDGYVRDATLAPEQNGDPDFGYLNSDRGSAFRTLTRGLDGLGTPEALARRWALIEFAASDPSPSLRAGAVEELLYVCHVDNKRAVRLFERLLKGHPSLLSSHRVQEFVYDSLGGFYTRVEAVIRAMMDFSADEVRQRGAELACIAAISPPVLRVPERQAAARALAGRTVTGPAPWRRGAARIYAHNLFSDPTGHCSRELVQLVSDEDDKVRRSIGHVFHSPEGALSPSLRPLIEAFAASRALGDDRRQFAEWLWEHGLLDPDWALSVVRAVLDNPHGPAEYVSYGIGEALVRLVIRIYTDPTAEDAVRTVAMDTFDRLMERYQADVQKVLGEWDRR